MFGCRIRDPPTSTKRRSPGDQQTVVIKIRKLPDATSETVNQSRVHHMSTKLSASERFQFRSPDEWTSRAESDPSLHEPRFAHDSGRELSSSPYQIHPQRSATPDGPLPRRSSLTPFHTSHRTESGPETQGCIVGTASSACWDWPKFDSGVHLITPSIFGYLGTAVVHTYHLWCRFIYSGCHMMRNSSHPAGEFARFLAHTPRKSRKRRLCQLV